jgi:hypothetical protein
MRLIYITVLFADFILMFAVFDGEHDDVFVKEVIVEGLQLLLFIFFVGKQGKLIADNCALFVSVFCYCEFLVI